MGLLGHAHTKALQEDGAERNLSGGKAGVVIHHKLSVIWRACVPFMCVVLCAGGFPLLMRLHERPPGTL